MKRRYASVPGHQLAIEEGGGGESSPKQPRLSEGGPVIQEMEEQDISNMTGSQLHDFLNISEGSVTTPVETEPPIIVQSSRPLQTPSPVKQETISSSSSQSSSSNGGSQQQGSKYRLVDPASVSPSLIQKIVKSEGLKRPVLHRLILTKFVSSLCYTLLYREISKEDFDLDINSMQKELDNLKDILSGQITLDSTLVSSLFNVDDGLPNM